MNNANSFPTTLAADERFIRLPEVLNVTGLSRASVYRLEKAGLFPRRLKLTENTVAWKLTDIRAWMESRVEAAR